MSNFEPPPQLVALTPEALLDVLKVQGPSERVTMKGIVKELAYWSPATGEPPKRCYGRLVLGDTSIKFQVPPETLLHEDEAVLLHGALRITQVKSGRMTHEVMLIGDVVSTWLPRQSVGERADHRLERVLPPMPLIDFLQEFPPSSLGFLVTDTAWQDIQANAQGIPGLESSPRIRTNFMKADKFLDDLQELSRMASVRGIVIARGGGEGLEVIGDSPEVIAALLECKTPFYAALGHSQDVLLIDKYADRAFSTPSAFSQALAKAVATVADVQDAEEREAALLAQKLELEERVSALLKKVASLETPSPEMPISVDAGWRGNFLFGLSLGLIASAVLFGLILWWQW